MENNNENIEQARFAVVVDGRIMFMMHYPELHPITKTPLMETAVMRSNPKIVEVPKNSPAQIGWVYDSIEFLQPSPEMMEEFMEYII